MRGAAPVTGPPGALLGLPAGLADAPADVVNLRYAVAIVAIAWAALLSRGRLRLAWLAGVCCVELVLVFWIAGFGRPYGVLVDPQVTRQAAETSAAALGGDEGALAGEALRRSPATWLASRGVPAHGLIALPTLLPLLTVPAIAWLVAAVPRPRADALLAASLWLAFSTAQSEAVRGAGFLPGLWARPWASVAVIVVVACVLTAGRLPGRHAGIAVGLLVVAAWALVPAARPPLPLARRLLVATVDQAPWILLGGWGLARGAPGGAAALVAGGATAFLVLPVFRHVDTWGAEALYRVGLILASAGPLRRLLQAVVDGLLSDRSWRAAWGRPEWVGCGALFLACVPGSFLARWDPGTLDEVALATREPLSSHLGPVFRWVRHNLPPDATCMASPEYAPMVAVLAQRRVLRAPSLGAPADDQRRRRVERMLLAGREPDLLRRYRVQCVVFLDGDQGWLGLDSGDALARAPGLTLLYADAHAKVYGVEP